jgi:hypothetical protein
MNNNYLNLFALYSILSEKLNVHVRVQA